jgi:hypothetical protein
LVRPEEVAEMAAFLKVSQDEFAARYLEVSPQGVRLTVADGVCVFLKDNGCGVHPVKPFICRQWPFFPAILVDPEELETAKTACPGIDPDCTHEDFVDAAMGRGEGGLGRGGRTRDLRSNGPSAH